MSTLLKKIQQQLDNQSSTESLLQTVQLLQAELIQHLPVVSAPVSDRVAVIMPRFITLSSPANSEESAMEHTEEKEEKVLETLKVDEKEIEEELEQIKRSEEQMKARKASGRPQFLFDPMEDVPTLAHQNPVSKDDKINTDISGFDYPQSLNDKLKEVKIELSQSLTSAPIKDLKKAIGVNDRFLFINELFRGDEAMYERSIKTIQNFSIYAEAEFWIRRELKVKIGWVDSDPVVKQFDQLVRRKFA
ncbi:MAG: hypothetical protein ABIW47_05005 [Ginsengibacter sp.]